VELMIYAGLFILAILFGLMVINGITSAVGGYFQQKQITKQQQSYNMANANWDSPLGISTISNSLIGLLNGPTPTQSSGGVSFSSPYFNFDY
jgi:hypothetical protein